jgi:urease accessory protein UreF
LNTVALHEDAAAAAAGQLLGDVRALAAQLGSAAGIENGAMPLAAWTQATPASPAALREFLAAYEREVLVPQEWPVICRAWDLTTRGAWCDLIQLDREWTACADTRPFAEASFRVGRRQLSRLRPLRDHRVVQRYLEAVESGEARGWHVLVYGVALAAFAIPLRQGLINYADQTLAGFVEGVPPGASLTEGQKLELLDDVCSRLPACLTQLLPSLDEAQFRLV